MLEDAKILLQEMIRNKCINPPGGEMRNIRTVSNFLNTHGVPHEVFESAPERGNLLAIIPGRGNGPSLMFGPSHVDVVPVLNEETWSIPPFEGIEKDGCIWGRGALDMLFFVACQTVVFSKLHQEGFKPEGDLKLLIVADEEAAGTYGAKWMVDNHPEKVKVDYLITEQGGEPLDEKRIVYWFAEKGMAWTQIKFKGDEQHGSAPYKSNNALVKLAKATQLLAEYQPPRDTQFIKPILDNLAIGGMSRKLASNTSTLPRVLESLSKDNLGMAKLFHALTQMTISPNLAKSGTKVNVVPGEATLYVDIRLLPGQNIEYAYAHVRKALGSLADEMEIGPIPTEEGGDSGPGTASDVSSPLVEKMQEVAKDLRGPETILVPFMSPGGTDARYFRMKFGTQAYGFALHDDTLDSGTIQALFHGDDERIPLGTIDLTAKAYYEIAKRFLS
jgi:acetylornithine deacetylase/succinyl-diaminopimelate desuccinylase-like protein